MTATTYRLPCTSFGVDFCLAAQSRELLQQMQARVPWGTIVTISESRDVSEFNLHQAANGYRITIDNKTSMESQNLEAALDELARALILYVADLSPDRVFVHAGVVAWRGRALVLPGASFAGKTTLVAELVRAGATYYSDEYAVLDSEGRVHPYTRELAIRCEGSSTQTPTRVDALGGTSGSSPLPISHVVFTHYARDTVWKPEPLSPGMAALEMLRHTIPVQRAPQRVMATLANMLQSAKAMLSQRGEAKETAHALLAIVAAEERHR